ncbi:LicD family-domain-containing protein [Chaetomium sp. MPI-SDFR-AT-0129]|nr:LicD family-domain-containing protein [Chaetomium sp. MPI-SDFR-AT-0129]
MRPLIALLTNQKVLLLLTAFVVFSGLFSTAAVARGGDQVFGFGGSQQQQQQQQPQAQHEQAPIPQAKSGPKPNPKSSRPVADSAPEYKYFQEAGGSMELTHYDARFFQGTVPYDEHREILTQLIRSYLTAFRQLGLETWLAHGTLLGWWWNGRILPWDFDVDAQVSAETLELLIRRPQDGQDLESSKTASNSESPTTDTAESSTTTITVHGGTNPSPSPSSASSTSNISPPPTDSAGNPLPAYHHPSYTHYNQTIHSHTSTNPLTGHKQHRAYLLDVNPFAGKLSRGRGENVIDARWIDMQTGMFVDITAVVEREPHKRPGVVSCKNFHRYKASGELFPLRESEFEGTVAMVPWDFEGVLVGEYGEKSLVVAEWEGHKWDPALKEWIRKPSTAKPGTAKWNGPVDLGQLGKPQEEEEPKQQQDKTETTNSNTNTAGKQRDKATASPTSGRREGFPQFSRRGR